MLHDYKSADFMFFTTLVVPTLRAISGARNVNEAQFWTQCATCWPIQILNKPFLYSSQQQQQSTDNPGSNSNPGNGSNSNPGSNANAGNGNAGDNDNNPGNGNGNNNSNERMNVVDTIPPTLLELIQEISVYNLTNSQNNSLLK